jgi:radical SAM superfamily enzyme YgiQ (UPF0313 family)
VGRVKDFTYYPYELAYLSSLLKKQTDHDIKMIDGNLLQLDAREYTDLLLKEQPDWLVMETSTAVYAEDLKVALALKRQLGTRIIFAGQHPSAFPGEVLADGADFVCRGEYEFSVLDLLQGENPLSIPGLYPNPLRSPIELDQLPFPEDRDVSRLDYAGVSGCDFREIEVYASRGCPMSCIFCVCGNLYYAKPNWRPRNTGNVTAELKYLKERYPELEGAFFDEEQHNGSKEFVHRLCQSIIKNKLSDLKFSAMCNYWNLDGETLKMMKEAGYYKLRIGIETASEKVAKAIRKPILIEKLRAVLRDAQKAGLRMYGTFIFGAPGSSREEDRKTLRLLKELLQEELLCDFQSSICVPQPGTPFYWWTEEKGYLTTKNWRKYNGYEAVVSYPEYPKEAIEEMFFQSRITGKKSKILSFADIPVALGQHVKRYGFARTVREAVRALRQPL